MTWLRVIFYFVFIRLRLYTHIGNYFALMGIKTHTLTYAKYMPCHWDTSWVCFKLLFWNTVDSHKTAKELPWDYDHPDYMINSILTICNIVSKQGNWHYINQEAYWHLTSCVYVNVRNFFIDVLPMTATIIRSLMIFSCLLDF